MTKEVILEIARANGIAAKNAHPHKSMGIDNHVWFIDEDYVFRSPLNEGTAKYMDVERDIWAYVQTQDFLVPEMVAQGDREDGLPYMIVRKVDGQLLGETDRAANLEPLIEDLVGQLVKLHSLQFPDRPEWRRPFDDFDPWPYFRKVWDLAALPRRDLLEIEAFMQRIGTHPGNFRGVSAFPKQTSGIDVLTHNDLHAWNLLVTGDTPRLASIIDWGDACVSDRRNDLATMPLDLQIQIAEAYRSEVKEVGVAFEARILWAWLDISFWEIMNMERLGFQRPWWRWPIGGWSRVKQILAEAPSGWQV